MKPDLSICIINTNNRKQTLDCLRSVFANTRSISLEVLVVDNACTDGSAEAILAEFPQVKLIRNTERLGYATNNNLALSRATGRYLMELNDDTIVGESALENMVDFLDAHPEAGVVGANLFNPDGTPQSACDYLPSPLYDGIRPLSTWLKPMRCDQVSPHEVGSVCSACLAVRREATEQVGLLDTDYDPIYSDEVDWCYRMHKVGWKIFHLPQARVIHLGSQTMNRVPLQKIERLYEKKALFFKKHYHRRDVVIFQASLFLVSVFKMLAWVILYPFRPHAASFKVSAHRRIAGFALHL